MPRSTQSPAAKILNYFRTADLSVAAEILGLAQDAVRERKSKSDKARRVARKGSKPGPALAAATPLAPVASAAPKKVVKAKPAKKAKAKKAKRQAAPAAEQEPPLPLEAPVEGDPLGEEYPEPEYAGVE